MRFVWAVLAFVIAAVLIGAGIAQRTVFLGPTTEVAEITGLDEHAYTLVDGSVLTSLPGSQTLRAEGEDVVFAAYGRTTDMTAWLADTTYTRVAIDEGTIATETVEPVAEEPDAEDASPAPEEAAPEDGSAADEGAAADAPGRNPAGSDLWLDEFSDSGTLTVRLQLPEDMSVLVASDGTQPAPARMTVTWPIQNATPWAGPLIVLGGIVMAAGVVLYFLGIRHARRSRGPRRKGPPPLPETQPIDTLPPSDGKGFVGSTPPRRALQRRALHALPALVVAGLVVSGCSAEAWPQLGPTPTPSPTATVLTTEDQQQPVVTETQAQRILARVAETVAEADAAGDADLAATRLDGAVLAERQTNYQIRSSVSDHPALPAIPSEPVEIVLPEAKNGWPRTFMTVVAPAEGESAAPSIAVLTQDDPWSEYRLTYLASLAASAEFPGGVAPATIGAAQVPPDSSFLVIEPQEIAAAYADVLNNGAESAYADLFQEDGDQFRVKVAEDRRTRLEQFNQTGAETGSLTFSSAAGAYEPIALATLESGAIVAVSVTETDTVRPTNEDAVIRLDGNPTVQALAGTSTSASGFETTFSDQLFFYVPNQADGGQIQLLGYASNILSAGVIQ
ncbi:glycosyl transferase [Microbacterium limosum]|uniref:Glycosyl transferase n=1 Tax=Microbacterium limosum TaxID=3079935 RepID=A0AAU0MJB5_9MICO|nr:glycosyl transferase [Microbacterium sp. Y20]WOQ70568.1 glycosyl transferase [Microbacterium sp. Y20]